ncbi:MAG: hypothetical protein LBC13_00625, partial [Clostridiales bacterium]|nr:hypothetical protein [Clostridiales bacterium]
MSNRISFKNRHKGQETSAHEALPGENTAEGVNSTESVKGARSDEAEGGVKSRFGADIVLSGAVGAAFAQRGESGDKREGQRKSGVSEGDRNGGARNDSGISQNGETARKATQNNLNGSMRNEGVGRGNLREDRGSQNGETSHKVPRDERNSGGRKESAGRGGLREDRGSQNGETSHKVPRDERNSGGR